MGAKLLAPFVMTSSRLLLLICFDVARSILVFDTGDETDREDKDDTKKKDVELDKELYHAGHAPQHVTRLGRFHHGSRDGMALIIKAEREWTANTALDTEEALADEEKEETSKRTRFLWMPKMYHQALREHHRKRRKARAAMFQQAPDEAEPYDTSLAQPGPASAMGTAVEGESDDAEINSNGADTVVMALELLRSEYMGPMGVGSTVPKECNPQEDARSHQASVIGTSRSGRRRRHASDQIDTQPTDEPYADEAVSEVAEVDDDAQADASSSVLQTRGVASKTRAEGRRGTYPDDHETESPLAVSSINMDSSTDDSATPGSGGLVVSDGCAARQQTYLNVVYDTGSTNIWIAADMCVKGGCVLPGRRRFNHSLSSTFSFPPGATNLTVQFGTGKLSGPLGTDVLRVGPVSIRQTFAMMQEQTGWIWEDVPIEGICGMAFPSLANTDGHTPFFDSVIEQKALKHNEFAFYISRENPAANALLWGGVDKKFYYGDVEWFTVVDPHYWSVELHEFKVGDKSFDLKDARAKSLADRSLLEGSHPHGSRKGHVSVAVLDTGTSVLGFSSTIVDQLLEMLPEAPCEHVENDAEVNGPKKYPDMEITLRNKVGTLRKLTLNGQQYMARDQDSGVCSAAIMQLDLPADHGPGIVLGDVFLREYFSVYDRRDGDVANAQVGLAVSKPTDEVISHLRSLTDTQQSLLHA